MDNLPDWLIGLIVVTWLVIIVISVGYLFLYYIDDGLRNVKEDTQSDDD